MPLQLLLWLVTQLQEDFINMATTNFINQQTVIQADWLNDVNNMTYVTGPGYSTSISALNSSKANAGANTDITSLGTVTVPTQANATANTTIANTLFVSNSIANIPATSVPLVPVRQTVLSGPIDANGFSSFGGSTGSTTVTAAGTLISTAANGFSSTGQTDRTGSITNPSWTSLSTNGTMYLYLDIASNGTCTTGSTTLAPVYQWGGTYSVTSGQFTFNIQSMSGQVGNGSTAAQTYRVFVGEVTVAGGVVTAIVWYALMGRYQGAYTATLPASSSQLSFNHNIGCLVDIFNLDIKCTTTDNGYSVGDIVRNMAISGTGTGSGYPPITPTSTSKTIGFSVPAAISYLTTNKTSGAWTALTAASWSYRMTAQRGW